MEVHGGPHAEYGWAFFHEFQILAGMGFLVFYMNPRGSDGYGEVFRRAVVKDWGGKDYLDLMTALDQVIERTGSVDTSRMGIGGGSYGGFMTNWAIGHTNRFAAAVSMRSIANLVSEYAQHDIVLWGELELGPAPWPDPDALWERSPIKYVREMKTPLLLTCGEMDLRCAISQSEELFGALRLLGQTAELVRFPEESHDISRNGRPDRRVERLRRIVGWFERYLGTHTTERAAGVVATVPPAVVVEEQPAPEPAPEPVPEPVAQAAVEMEPEPFELPAPTAEEAAEPEPVVVAEAPAPEPEPTPEPEPEPVAETIAIETPEFAAPEAPPEPVVAAEPEPLADTQVVTTLPVEPQPPPEEATMHVEYPGAAALSEPAPPPEPEPAPAEPTWGEAPVPEPTVAPAWHEEPAAAAAGTWEEPPAGPPGSTWDQEPAATAPPSTWDAAPAPTVVPAPEPAPVAPTAPPPQPPSGSTVVAWPGSLAQAPAAPEPSFDGGGSEAATSIMPAWSPPQANATKETLALHALEPEPSAQGEPPAKLTFETGPFARRVVGIPDSSATVGRAPDNDIIIGDPATSGHHCRIEVRAGAYWVSDLGSTNGTLVNGEPIIDKQLDHGDVISVGQNTIRFTLRS
jgi:dienelactone hydrolase